MLNYEKMPDYISNIIATALLCTGNKQNEQTLRTEHQRVVKELFNDELKENK